MSSLNYVHAAAVLDGPENRYRYSLERRWGSGKKLCYIMLNPSTADGESDDPTVRKCVGFAKLFGAEAIEVVNLFAFRATIPDDLYEAKIKGIHVIGPSNAAHIERAVMTSDFPPIAAWGTRGSYLGRDQQVIDQITRELGRPISCLHMTKDGCPGHPLYIPYSAEVLSFRSAVQ